MEFVKPQDASVGILSVQPCQIATFNLGILNLHFVPGEQVLPIWYPPGRIAGKKHGG
jgi:hypothetical protein